MIRLSIVIPCYNEAENIPLLVGNIKNLYKPNIEIILVDNGSTDNTYDILLKEFSSIGNELLRCIRVENNIGYGHGIMAGVKEAKGEIIAWTHADLQTDIKDVFNGFKIFMNQSDKKNTFLKGNRKERYFIDLFLTWSMGKISSIMLGEKLNDINAQPKMFHRTFLQFVDNAPDDFSLDLYFYSIAVEKKMNILDLPVYFQDRQHGEAKGGGGSSIWTRIKVIIRTIKYIHKLSSKKIKTVNS